MTKVLLLTFFFTTAAWAQPPAGTSDLLPLAVGNRWLYHYYDNMAQYVETYLEWLDSGQVEITVTGASFHPDTIVWHLQETADYRHKLWRDLRGNLVQDTILHTQSFFDLQESLSGNHALVNGGPSLVFQFTPPSYVPYDTMVVYRYGQPDSSGLMKYSTSTQFYGYRYLRSLVFQAGVGLDSLIIPTQVYLKFDSCAAQLLDRSLVGITPPEEQMLPEEFSLFQNFPNPFNPATMINYTIGRGADFGTMGLGDYGRNVLVQLIVYDILGRQVAVLVNEPQRPGSYTVTFDGSHLASGVYFYRLDASGYSQTRKLMLLK